MNRWPPLTILAAWVLFLSCGGSSDDVSPHDKLVNIAILEDTRDMSGGELLDYLGDSDPEVRARAAVALGRMGQPIAVFGLGNLLIDSVEIVRIEAAFAIGQIGDSSGIIPIAANLKNEKSAEVKCAMIEALGKIGHPDVVGTIISYAAEPDPAIRSSVAFALAYLPRHGRTQDLVQLSRDSIADVRWKAVYAMSRTADSTAFGRLHWCLKDSVSLVRLYAARAIGALNDSSGLSHLTDRLRQESDDFVKVNLIRSIARVGDRQALKSLLNILSEEHPGFVKADALTAIGELGFDKAFAKLKPFVLEEDHLVRGCAIEAAARISPEFFMENLPSFRERADWYVKSHILDGLSVVGTKEAFDIATEFFSDEDPRVRRAALTAIIRFKDSSIHSYLERGLDDPDFAVNMTAVDAIASRKDSDLIERVAAFYAGQVTGGESDARLAVVQAFSSWMDSTSPNPTMLGVFNRALNDVDYHVRNAAVHALAEMGIDRSSSLGVYQTKIERDNYGDFFKRFPRNPTATIRTNKGDIKFELLYDIAPKTVDNFVDLARSGFYNRNIWHRVIPGFIIQDGCPRGDGWGGPGYTIRCEWNRKPYTRGTVGMAHSGKDTGGSQFFITHTASPHLNGRYTAFGQVISGMRVVNRIEIGDSIRTIEISSGDSDLEQ